MEIKRVAYCLCTRGRAVFRTLSVVCFFCFFCLACAPALPVERPEGEMEQFLNFAQKSAREAEGHAKECRMQLEQSEQLLQEVRAMLARAEEADKHCAELVKKIPKRRKIRRKKEEKKPEEEEKNSDGPLWSPSDAPPGAKR